MYRLLIVDDEAIEREGMERLIPWGKYGIEMVGTARNGVEGCEMIERVHPDIVLTDIAMPVMDGIELIRQAQGNHPEIVFVVLSGYGEYEYTSRAMELGVRHYILKPCDEHKIMHALNKAKEELEQNRKQDARQQEMEHAVQDLMPLARENIFRYALLGKEQPSHRAKMLEVLGSAERRIVLLAFQRKTGFAYAQHHDIVDQMTKQLPEGSVLFSTAIDHTLFLLVDAGAVKALEYAVIKVRNSFNDPPAEPLLAAASRQASCSEIKLLHDETMRMLNAGYEEMKTGLFSYASLTETQRQAERLVSFSNIRQAKSYDTICFECFVTLTKMNLLSFDDDKKRATFEWALRFLFGEGVMLITQRIPREDSEMLPFLADVIAQEQGLLKAEDYKARKQSRLIHALYENITKQEMSIQFLAEERLYMNADYLGKQYLKIYGKKFSACLLDTRILLAKRLLAFDPDVRILQLATAVGFAPDGQYFSKVFRKATGMSPKEYKDHIPRHTGE